MVQKKGVFKWCTLCKAFHNKKKSGTEQERKWREKVCGGENEGKEGQVEEIVRK